MFYLKLFYLMFYLIIYPLLFNATSSDRVCPEPNHAGLGRLQRTMDRRLNARWAGKKEIVWTVLDEVIFLSDSCEEGFLGVPITRMLSSLLDIWSVWSSGSFGKNQHAKNMLDTQAPKLFHLAPALMFLPSFLGADGVGVARIFSMMQNQVLGFDGFPLLWETVVWRPDSASEHVAFLN